MHNNWFIKNIFSAAKNRQQQLFERTSWREDEFVQREVLKKNAPRTFQVGCQHLNNS